VLSHPHVWAVRFHSACQSFEPAWLAAVGAVPGLHWGSVNIDVRDNVPLAQRLGVLQEGIPNVKLINAGSPGGVVNVMANEEVFGAEELIAKLQAAAAASASLDSSNFYQPDHAEL